MPGLVLASDTSPLLYLGRIGQLEFLPRLFAPVYVPEQVVLELDAGRLLRGDTPDPRGFPWVQMVAVTAELITTLPPNTFRLGERPPWRTLCMRGRCAWPWMIAKPVAWHGGV